MALSLVVVSIISIYFASIPFALSYYLNGLTPQWYIGDLTASFATIFSLTAIINLSVLATPIALLVAFAYWLALIIYHRLLWLLSLRFRLAGLRRRWTQRASDTQATLKPETRS